MRALLGLAPDVRCLEVSGGRGSIARWLCQEVAPRGQVTATDLDTGFLSELSLPNLTVLRHDVRTDGFPEGSFGLVHVRAVLMHMDRHDGGTALPADLTVLGPSLRQYSSDQSSLSARWLCRGEIMALHQCDGAEGLRRRSKGHLVRTTKPSARPAGCGAGEP